MEKQLIDFIQNPKNIELLNLGQIDTLLQKCPVNFRPQLLKMLADSDIKLQDSGDSMYGIQTAQLNSMFRDTYKLTVKSPNRKSNPLAYGASLIKSAGVSGGSLVAFKSLKDAYKFIQFLGEDGNLSPFKLSSAKQYNWVEVPYKENPGIKFWITETMRDYYDLDKRKYQKQVQNAYEKLRKEFSTIMLDKYFLAYDLEKYLQNELSKDIYGYIGVYLRLADKGYQIIINSYSQDSFQQSLDEVRVKVSEFLKQHNIDQNELVLKIVKGGILLQLNNTQFLNDIANKLNAEFGVDLQQSYPEIFS